MANNWSDLGKDLNRMVDDAIRNKNFHTLNASINRAVESAFNMISSGARDYPYDFKLSDDKLYEYEDAEIKNYQKAVYEEARLYKPKKERERSGTKLLIGGIILTVLGLNSVISSGMYNINLLFMSIAILLCGIWLIISGRKRKALSRSFDSYIKALDKNEYININILAPYAGETEKQCRKNLKKMFKLNWFLQGHMDSDNKCLMVTDDVFKMYIDAFERMKNEKKNKQSEDEDTQKMSAESRRIIDRGREYIAEIRRSNNAIPGEEISNKIYRMENLVKKIFDYAEANTDSIADLQKLMDYYLPMTVKLLNAYEELDRQNLDVENITNTKKEIEDAMDSLNIAFENMLDDLFRDKAWDISSDISVLESILAQEGLTDEKPFEQQKN